MEPTANSETPMSTPQQPLQSVSAPVSSDSMAAAQLPAAAPLPQPVATVSQPVASPTGVPAAAPTPMGPAALRVVIVEDNTSLADIYKTRLEALGYTCFVAYDGQEALATIQRELPNLVLLDLMVPKIAGDQILATMRANDWGKNTKVLIVSNLNESDAPEGLREQGIVGYAVKANLTNDQLDRMVDRILKPEDQQEDVLLETKGSEAYQGQEDTATPA